LGLNPPKSSQPDQTIPGTYDSQIVLSFYPAFSSSPRALSSLPSVPSPDPPLPFQELPIDTALLEIEDLQTQLKHSFTQCLPNIVPSPVSESLLSGLPPPYDFTAIATQLGLCDAIVFSTFAPIFQPGFWAAPPAHRTDEFSVPPSLSVGGCAESALTQRPQLNNSPPTTPYRMNIVGIIFLDLSFEAGMIDALIRGIPDLISTHDPEIPEQAHQAGT
jgi:hypothetical protein